MPMEQHTPTPTTSLLLDQFQQVNTNTIQYNTNTSLIALPAPMLCYATHQYNIGFAPIVQQMGYCAFATTRTTEIRNWTSSSQFSPSDDALHRDQRFAGTITIQPLYNRDPSA
jgi:hypothetical protein